MMDPEPVPTPKNPHIKKPTSQTVPGILLRILLVLITGIVIGAVIYFSASGWVPYLEQRVFEPIRANQEQIDGLQRTQTALEEQLTTLAQDQGENELIYARNLEATITAAVGTIDHLNYMVENLTAYNFTQVPGILSSIIADQGTYEAHLSAIATAQIGYIQSGPGDDLLQITALLTWANQYLLHDNYGLAQDELLLAQHLAAEMVEEGASNQRPQSVELLALIEEVLEDLPQSPELASVKLELAWQLSLRMMDPSSEPGQTSTPTPSPAAEISATPTPN